MEFEVIKEIDQPAEEVHSCAVCCRDIREGEKHREARFRMDERTHEIRICRSCTESLHQNAVFVMNMEWTSMDVKVTYKDNGRIFKDISFMMPMLTAEAIGRVETLLELQEE